VKGEMGLWSTPFSGGSEAQQRDEKGGGSGGTTWCSLAMGPGPDSQAASRPRPNRSWPSSGARGRRALFEQGRGASGHWCVGPGRQQERGVWARGLSWEKKRSGPSPYEQ
jgi:hypothetical protein